MQQPTTASHRDRQYVDIDAIGAWYSPSPSFRLRKQRQGESQLSITAISNTYNYIYNNQIAECVFILIIV